MLDIKVTNKPGTSKIVYVMQSDVDSSLFVYIGKEFSMKDGNWTYAKYDMNGVTPLQLKTDLAKNGWHEVNPSTAPAKVIDDDLAEKKGIDGEDATVNDPENPMADCDTVKKVDCNKLADDLFDIANKFGDFIKNTQRAAKDGETVKDDLIESSSEEALQKNIATEIEAGKDPKQAAAIAYSVQRENDAADKWVRGPRGTFKVVEGTEEDLKKDGYGFHHDFEANGKHYSVMVKNDEAVAVEDEMSVKDKLIGNGEVSFRYSGSKIKSVVYNRKRLPMDKLLDISRKYGCTVEKLNSDKNRYWEPIKESVYLIGNANDEQKFCEAWHEINPAYSVKELMSLRDSSIKDGHGILSSGQEATLRRYCDKYEVDFNKAYQEIERQLKKYPGKKVDALIEGLLDDMVTGIFDCGLKDSKDGFENYLEVYDSDMKDSRIMDSDQTDILNEIKSKYPFVKFENMHFEKGSDAASKGYKMDYFTFDITGQLPSNLERFDHTVKQPFERFVEWVMKKRGYRPTVFSEARGGSLKVKVRGMKVYKATDSEASLKDAELKVGGVHHDRYGNKYTIKKVQYPGDSKRGNEQGIVDVYVEKKSGPSHNAFFDIDKFKRMIVDSRSVRDSLTVGGKYRWEKKFGNLPLELRNIDEYVLLAAGDKMASLKTEEFAKLLESGEVQSIGEGYLPEYSGIKTDYKVKVGDRMFIVKATSKEDARRKLIQSLDRKLK